jgi:predicted ATP-grasp superfamily ATP-dependent carboligase
LTRLLVVCLGFGTLQYRVLRCAADAADEVHALGPASSRRITASRHLTRFHPAAHLDDPIDHAAAASEIDRAARELGVAMVVPGDGRAVRLFAQLRHRLRAACFPVPSAPVFDLLNDKWRFGQLCGELGVPYPEARLFADLAELRAAAGRGELTFPIIAKPIDQAGGRGVVVIRSVDELRGVGRGGVPGGAIDYAPVLAQRFVEGDDICLSAFCRAGVVLADVVYRKRRGDCLFTENPELVELAGHVLGHVAFDGVANFDARLDRAGRVHLVECNPRFWYTMDMALLAGINFVALGLQDAIPRDAGARTVGAVLLSNASLLRALRAPWTLTSLDLAVLRDRLRDPVPVLHALGEKLRDRLGVARPPA